MTSPKCGLDELSPRERQILAQAATGLTDKEIAVRVGVSITTVRTYWERLFQKTGSVNRASAVAFLIHGEAAEVPPCPELPLEPNTLLQAAVDMTVGGVIALGEDDVITAANEKAHALLNCPLGTLVGEPIGKHIQELQETFYRVLAAAREGEGDSMYTVTVFVKVLGGPALMATVTLRAMQAPDGRHIVLFLQDYIAEVDARRRGTSYRLPGHGM